MECFRDCRILVVGGAGFVGGNLVRRLTGFRPRRILVVDNLLSSERLNVPDDPAVDFVEGSIADDKILADLPDDLDYVFHLSTFHGNQNSIHDPLADHEHNTLTTLKLFHRLKDCGRTRAQSRVPKAQTTERSAESTEPEASATGLFPVTAASASDRADRALQGAERKGLKKVVYASAGCTVAAKTYDEAVATQEDAPVSLFLDSPYQMSKIFGEFYANYYWGRYGLPVVKARFQNVYGPGEILGAGKWRGTEATIWRNVTPTFIYRALAHLPLPLENEGRSTRDFIFVDDIVEGLLRCAERGRAGDVYNLASGRETTIRELAETINLLTGNPAGVELRPRRDWDRSGKRFGSPAKAKQELGFSATTPLREGLHRTIAWTRENLALIESCMARHPCQPAAA